MLPRVYLSAVLPFGSRGVCGVAEEENTVAWPRAVASGLPCVIVLPRMKPVAPMRGRSVWNRRVAGGKTCRSEADPDRVVLVRPAFEDGSDPDGQKPETA
jgi:hypothetical protein